MAKLNLIAGLKHAYYRSITSAEGRENLQSYELSNLYALNFPARRILYRRSLYNVLKAIKSANLYLVTLCHSGHSTVYQKSAFGAPFLQYPDLATIRNDHQSALRNFNYFGIIECQPLIISVGGVFQRLFNWHSHSLVFDTSPQILSARIRNLNRSENWNPVTSFETACHWKTVTHSVDRVVGYGMKFPRKEIVISRPRDRTISPKDPQGRSLDYRRSVRLIPGLKTTIVAYQLLKNLLSEELLIAGGKGSAVRKAALRQALQEYKSGQNKLWEKAAPSKYQLRSNEEPVETSRFSPPVSNFVHEPLANAVKEDTRRRLLHEEMFPAELPEEAPV
jgi:hypothetical protein